VRVLTICACVRAWVCVCVCMWLQPTAHSPPPTALSPQPTAHSPQPTADSPQPTANSLQLAARSPQCVCTASCVCNLWVRVRASDGCVCVPAAHCLQPAARSPQPTAHSPQPPTLTLTPTWRADLSLPLAALLQRLQRELGQKKLLTLN